MVGRMKKPCGECPFRKRSSPGWIGNYESVKEIVDHVESDYKFPCHMDANALIDEDAGHGDMFERSMEANELASPCIGGLQFMNNKCKLSRDKEIARVQREVGKNPDVFSSVLEMVAHHDEKRKVVLRDVLPRHRQGGKSR